MQSQLLNTLSPILICGILLAIPFSNVLPNRWLRILLAIIVFGLFVAVNLMYITVLRTDETAYRLPNYSLMIFVAGMWGMLIARLTARRHAGHVVLKLKKASFVNTISLTAAAIFLLMTLFVAQPSMRSEIDGTPLFDAYYFSTRFILVLGSATATIYFLIEGLERTELRARGVVQGAALWRWNEFKSFEWGSVNADSSTASLRLRLKRRMLLINQMQLMVPTAHKQDIDALLASNL